MKVMTNKSYESYKKSYRGSVTSASASVTEPGMEIVLNKQEVIYTDNNGKIYLINRIQTNKRVYWMHNNEILEDGFEEIYKVVNRDSKIDTLLNEVE